MPTARRALAKHSRAGATMSAPRRLICANCRRRKTKCDGTQPGCKTCEVYKEECRYDKPPPMSQIIAMSEKIQGLEQTIEVLKQQLHMASAEHRSAGSPTFTDQEQASLHTDLAGSFSADTFRTARQIAIGNSKTATDATTMLAELSLDENGQICYHGPTSLVHDPPDSTASLVSPQPPTATNLTSFAIEARNWETFATGNGALRIGIAVNILTDLLHAYWTWNGPLFMWVYRPAFIRDMITEGPYYSDFLLTVMCAHASRFSHSRVGELLMSRVRLLLGTEILKSSSICTAQALLQLSARELASGSMSQAWLYSGMAFRMAVDLGVVHSALHTSYADSLNNEDAEIRRRFFWSCYFWDKAISLYFGRRPAMADLPADIEPNFVDDIVEHDTWSPVYIDAVDSPPLPAQVYNSTPSHAISCFQNSCRLSILINDIILALYTTSSSAETNTAFNSIRRRLNDWRAATPQHLKCEPFDFLDASPPPHIITQNVLYYTSIILLHRPFNSIREHHITCCQASDRIEQLLLLFEKSFSFARITYLMAYCIYTAASTRVCDARSGDATALAKMETFLRALRAGCKTCPSLTRSLSIITNDLSKSQNKIPEVSEDSAVMQNYLPAFPYLSERDDLMNEDPQVTGVMESFSFLESFPESTFQPQMSEY